MTAPPAALALVLHAHLPWVRHDDHDALEERWLFEAITECYLPLLAVCDGLARDGVPGSLALSLSPTLLAMLRDAALRARFEKHFVKLTATLTAAKRRLDARFHPALDHHARRLDAAWAMWTHVDGDLPAAFDAHRRAGRLSLWTSAAPHPLLPLWADRRWFLDLALDRAIALHRNVFGDDPGGVWLPECGVAPGVLVASILMAGLAGAALTLVLVPVAALAPIAGVVAAAVPVLVLRARAAARRRALSQAKVQLGQSMRFVGQQCTQMHGGIGVTDEYAGSHYFKRLTVMEMQWGDTLHHLGETSARMQDTAGVFA